MKKIYSGLLFLIILSSCKTQENSGKINSKDCYTPASFSMLKKYIADRIATSGMGKFYVEYPPDPEWIDDGIKRPSKHPENVYDVTYNSTVDQIHFENKKNTFIFFSKEGLLLKMGRTNSDIDLANKIYCFMIDMAESK
ncbi:MAG: hypothetical protein ABI462_11855 [Ignavibacteria bacterium]